MKRILSFGHLDGVRSMSDRNYKLDDINIIPNEKEQVFDFIFAPDEITGLPNNALGVFMDDTAPQVVRDFVRQNLIGIASTESIPDGLPQSDIETLTRGRYETIDEYVERVNVHLDGIRDDYQKKLLDAQLKERRKVIDSQLKDGK